jgi:hypothetical protein
MEWSTSETFYQGEQIERIVAFWWRVYFRQFFDNYVPKQRKIFVLHFSR